MIRRNAQTVAGVVLFATAGVLFLVGLFMLGPMQRPAEVAAPPVRPSAAVAAARPISRGQTLTAEDLQVIALPGPAPANAFAAVEPLLGRTAVADLQPNQVVTAANVSDDPAAAGLAALVPDGLRAVAIHVTDEIAVGNFLRPGDHADLVVVLPGRLMPGTAAGAGRPAETATEARLLLQDVRVLTVGPRIGVARTEDDKGRAAELRHVTLAVTPEQANELALVRTIGEYALSLRHAGDRSTVTAEAATLAGIRGEAPRISAPARAALQPPQPPRRVEVLRGRDRVVAAP